MIQNVIDYFKGDLMATDVYIDKYQMKDEKGTAVENTPDDMHLRMAKEFARVEFNNVQNERLAVINPDNLASLSDFGKRLMYRRNVQTLEEIIFEFYSYFQNFSKIVPQGSIMSNLGNKYVFGSLSNCFGIADPLDSYAGILRTDEELAHLMKRRGGVGTGLHNLRYTKASVTNAARSSTGVPSFAERYSNTTREVAQEGRRGALMLLLICKHPDIFKFVTMKDDRTKVTGANVTVMLTDEFMEAVKADEDFICRFPVTTILPEGIEANTEHISEYNKIYEIVVNNAKISIMKIHAKELFDLIAEMAWKNGEPGNAFIDRIVDYCPDGVYEQYKPTVCNPCAEQWFSFDETCRLIAVNFFGFVDNPFTSKAAINYDRVYDVCYMQQRLGDDLVDLEVEYIDRILVKLHNDPEPIEIKRVEIALWNRIQKKAREGRRTGSGLTGLGDMLASLNLKYDSDEALALTELVMKKKMEAELDATIDMAITRGTFTGWNKDLEFEQIFEGSREYSFNGTNSFYKIIRNDFEEQAYRMYQHGRRNVNWSNIAPGGSISILTQTTSGGEPIFKAYYIRRKKIVPGVTNVRVDFVDQNGDSWQEYAVLHPKFKEWIKIYLISNVTFQKDLLKGYTLEPRDVDLGLMEDLVNCMDKDKIQKLFKLSPWYGSEADDIDWIKRVEMQSILQKYTSNAISSTINLPKDVPLQTVKDIYMAAYDMGLKGVTVYRDTSRSGVLITEPSKITTTDKFGYTNAIKRPKELVADYRFVVSGKKQQYAIITGLLDGNPYEIFAFENPEHNKHIVGKLIKEGKGVYKFTSDEYTIENVQLKAEDTDERLLTRFISSMLRHGMNPKYIIGQVEKSEMGITKFAKAITRVLKHYIPDKESLGEKCENCPDGIIVYEEGCKKCKICGYSKC